MKDWACGRVLPWLAAAGSGVVRAGRGGAATGAHWSPALALEKL